MPSKLLPSWLADRVAHRPLLARALDNIAWLLLDKVLKAALGFAMAVWLARHLGPAEFGTYSFVLALVAMFSGLASLGLPSIAVRELVRDPGARDEILGTVAMLMLGGSVIAVLLLLGAAGWVRADDAAVRAAVAAVAGTLVFQSTAVVRCWFESRVASRHVVVAEAAAMALGAGIKAALILGDAPLETFFWAVLAESALLAALLLWTYARREGGWARWRASAARASSLLRHSWPIVVSAVVLMVQARIDQLMLAELAGDTELGHYSVALRVAEALVFFSLVLNSTMFPLLVDARARSAVEYHRKLMAFYRASFAAAVAICLPLAAVAPWLVAALFGAAYEPAGLLLAWMAGRVFLAFMGVARGSYLIVENLQAWAALTLVAGTLLNVLLNLWWIPSRGGLGAVWASLVSFAVTSFVLDLLHAKARGNVFDMARASLTFWRLRGA
jgi:O-antigen/teichoic acid export membrane protein